MRKFRFALQVFILAVSFPVLFIAGINSGNAGQGKGSTQQIDSLNVKRSFPAADNSIAIRKVSTGYAYVL